MGETQKTEIVAEMENRIYYRVTFYKPGCCYDRCFTNEDERNKFADSMKKAGFKVTVYNS